MDRADLFAVYLERENGPGGNERLTVPDGFDPFRVRKLARGAERIRADGAQRRSVAVLATPADQGDADAGIQQLIPRP